MSSVGKFDDFQKELLEEKREIDHLEPELTRKTHDLEIKKTELMRVQKQVQDMEAVVKELHDKIGALRQKQQNAMQRSRDVHHNLERELGKNQHSGGSNLNHLN